MVVYSWDVIWERKCRQYFWLCAFKHMRLHHFPKFFSVIFYWQRLKSVSLSMALIKSSARIWRITSDICLISLQNITKMRTIESSWWWWWWRELFSDWQPPPPLLLLWKFWPNFTIFSLAVSIGPRSWKQLKQNFGNMRKILCGKNSRKFFSGSGPKSDKIIETWQQWFDLRWLIIGSWQTSVHHDDEV